MNLSDLWRETWIGIYYHLWLASDNRKFCERMVALIRQRSPQQVKRMEKAKGLV